MADFYQSGVVATLHRLGCNDNTAQLERELERLSRRTSIALVLPCLYSEFSGPAIFRIIEELKRVRYLDRIVVSLARTDAAEFSAARRHFSVLPQEIRYIWNDGPRIQALYRLLSDSDLSAGEDGKGRSCWLAYGYLLAAGCDVIALHDCDILTYTRELLARLVYPVANPSPGFDFAKGYYARVSTRMNGRVTRLFLSPLLRSLQATAGALPILSYLDSFRYPLAGEFAMKADLARVHRIPGDWGLEIGVLSEVYRNCGLKRICQTELCDNYDHKHQPLSPGDPGKGLHKMSIDIGKALFRAVESEGVAFTEALLQSLLTHYTRNAREIINHYRADAAINGLSFDRHEEEAAVTVFADGLLAAGEQHISGAVRHQTIPDWNRVSSAIPEFTDMLYDAVERDSGAAVPAVPMIAGSFAGALAP